MLARIRLENFKSWRELAIQLAPLTVLFGTNSLCKTGILQRHERRPRRDRDDAADHLAYTEIMKRFE
jgi:hypothetical protein